MLVLIHCRVIQLCSSHFYYFFNINNLLRHCVILPQVALRYNLNHDEKIRSRKSRK